MSKKMIVGYCRLSRDDGNDQSTSIINQKKIITKWAEDNNMSIDKWYCDDGYTGINFDRPDMKKLIADDYLNYKNCLAIPECLNDTDENVNQALDIETIIDISNWINESFKNINKKTLF